ncbi:HET-domain-containing protein [Tothia fuscella]|uniref:HET-domain-containing protein n=1 Tax=Tothia fuscella TaxID=1048955 RepID=A0A9P4U065_9PEZI|nr:HET-domain-containing protein [Tothia fuscella]
MPEENSSNAELKNCKHCRDITLERLAAPGGYLHAPSRSSLVRSAQKCGLCSLLFRKDRSRRNSQIFLALEPFSDDDPQMCLKIGHMSTSNDTPVRNQLAFFLYTSLEDPAAVSFGITAKRELSNTQSEASYNIATKWIDDCVENHSCSTHLSLSLKERDNMFPTRLLDVEAFGDADQDIRLVDHDGVFKRYTTLSYCWGNSRAFTTTSRSIRLRKTRIAFSTLPKTFQDAVDITRRLRVRYLWIDALAIIQDDKLDWQRESAKMGAVYSMSFLTIAADAGVDCNSGCFNLSSTSQELASENAPFELPSKTVTGEESHLFLWDPSRGTRRPTPPEIDGSPLAERGWCCQERILSPRILHYTTSQLFWECRQVLLAEDGLRPWSMWTGKSETVPGLAANLYGTTSDLHGLIRLLDIWYNNVVAQSYSRRKLTREEDKLTAISGIARAFFRHFRCEYIAGLWLDDLSFGLSWRRRGVVQKPSSYRSPTFSWASLDCIVEWPLRTESHKSSLKIEKIHVELESQDPFGRLSSCWLIITGHIRQAFIVCNKRISAGGYDLVWELKSTSSKLLGTAFMDEDDYQDVPKLVDCLILSEDEKAGQALILERLPSSDRYQRIGVAATHGYERDDGFFDQSAAQTITIF